MKTLKVLLPEALRKIEDRIKRHKGHKPKANSDVKIKSPIISGDK